MTTAMFFLIYPAVFITGAILTQFGGNAHRPFHEGVLAWLFLPLGIIACISGLASEGMKGLKHDLHEFGETLLNYRFKTSEKKTQDAHRMKGDFA